MINHKLRVDRPRRGPRSEASVDFYAIAIANRNRTVFYTPQVSPRPKELVREIEHWQGRVGICVDEHQRALGNITGSSAGNYARWVELLIIDEAERLTPAAASIFVIGD